MIGTTLSIFGLFFLIGSINTANHQKIIGGENTVIKDFPFLVSIRSYGAHHCGGTIISERHVLTAAHCMENYHPMEYTVHSGTSKSDKKGNVHRIEAVHNHPKYDKADQRGHYNDISVITLKYPIVFNKYQQKIDLPKHNVQNYEVGYVIGWGRNSREDWNTVPTQLQKLRVVLLPTNTCQAFVPRELRQGQVCSFRSVGTGFCHGDSGGPVIVNREVVGIVSYVLYGDCASEIPSVYTNVFAYKDFIESAMNE